MIYTHNGLLDCEGDGLELFADLTVTIHGIKEVVSEKYGEEITNEFISLTGKAAYTEFETNKDEINALFEKMLMEGEEE